MTTLDSLKNRLIDRIMITKNEKLLAAIESIFTSTQEEDILNLTSEQVEMLQMSERDIENGDLISESDLDKSDAEWMS